MSFRSVLCLRAVAITILLVSQVRGNGEQVLWTNDRITPDQPFPAKICAVANLWPGYDLLLEEIGGGRLCVARLWHSMVPQYSILDLTVSQKRDAPTIGGVWIHLTPSIEIARFSWSMGVFPIGRRFEDDLLAQSLQYLAFRDTASAFRASSSMLAPWSNATPFPKAGKR